MRSARRSGDIRGILAPYDALHRPAPGQPVPEPHPEAVRSRRTASRRSPTRRLAGLEADLELGSADVRAHGPGGDQVHLDPAALLVPPRLVAEGLDVEVAVELAVDAGQHVAIEGGGHAGGVVVRGQEHRHRLDQVGGQEQHVARAQAGADVGEELVGGLAIEVADGAAEKEHDRRPLAAAGQRGVEAGQVLVLDHVDLDAVDAVEVAGARGEGLRRDVDRAVQHRLAGGHRGDEAPRLLAAAGAELDDDGRRRHADRHRVGVAVEDALLGAGEPVLGQEGDGLEEGAADVVVEPARGQGARGRGQPVPHVAGKGGAGAVGEGDGCGAKCRAAHGHSSTRRKVA
jgi:hypothetical protein